MTVEEIITGHTTEDTWDIRKIVMEYLVKNGFDGLYTNDYQGCACGKNNLIECSDGCWKDCEPGYEYPSTDSEFDVMIGSKEDMKQAVIILKERGEDEEEVEMDSNYQRENP